MFHSIAKMPFLPMTTNFKNRVAKINEKKLS